MSNYKSNSQQQNNACFSFSHSKNNSRELTQPTGRLTSADQRGIVGWISSLLQPFGEEFTNALKHSEGRGVVGLNTYIAFNYPHLKEIVRYFIIASLSDDGWVKWDEEPIRKPNGDALLDILIEELGARFFRESQWLVKIMHLPFYQVFAKLDSYAKGYVTLRQLAAFSGLSLNFQAPSTRHLTSKLKRNLGGLLERIYQQNLREAQLRVDITSFAQEQLQKGIECSQTYAKIYTALKSWGERVKEEKASLQKLDAEHSKMLMENLELSREDLRIRSISRNMVEGHQTPAKTKTSHKQQSTNHAAKSEHSLTRNSFKAQSYTKADERPALTLEDLHHSTINASIEQKHVLREEQEHSKKMTELANLQAEAIYAKEQEKLLVRAAILSQLQQIKFARFHNRHHLFTYI